MDEDDVWEEDADERTEADRRWNNTRNGWLEAGYRQVGSLSSFVEASCQLLKNESSLLSHDFLDGPRQ